MKKKNVIGHMVAEKESSASWFRRLDLFSRLICLLLAVLIWLIVVNATDDGRSETQPDPNVPLTEYAEE